MHSIFLRRDRQWLLAVFLVVAMMVMTCVSLLTPNYASAAAPTGASAVIQNTTSTTVDIVVTGTDFDQFVDAQATTANSTDLAGITYDSANPQNAVINNATTMTLTFAISIGTDKSGGALTIDAGIVEDSGDTPNLAISIADGSITDNAAPAVLSTTPAASASGVGIGDAITIVFTEPMDTTFAEDTEYDLTPDPGDFAAAAWSAGNTTVTLAHTTNFTYNTTYTLVIDEAEIDASTGSTVDLIATADQTFSTEGHKGSNVPAPPITYELEVLSPNGGESYMAGDEVTIKWLTAGSGLINYVNLYYVADGAQSVIEEAARNSGSYDWTAPAMMTDNAKILVEATDLIDVIVSDDSDEVFSIGEVDEPVDDQTDDQADDTDDTDDTWLPADPADSVTGIEITEPGTGIYYNSPVTGKIEEISVLNKGDYFRSSYFDTVYYLDNDGVRHPFNDLQTFYTWQDSFDSVKVVTDVTLTQYDLGTPMLPKPGVVLVKIQSVDAVYAVETNPEDAFSPLRRWIMSEEAAENIYGTDWADYVIDLSPTMMGKYTEGDSIYTADDITVDLGMMKTRVSLFD